MVEVSVCIVNYNTRERLRECLDSIYRKTEGISYEIIVVDNDSRDGSSEMIQSYYPGAMLIPNKENRGYAQANNQAIKEAQGEYLLFLNPDTVLLSNALLILRDFLEQYPNAGAVGCRLLNSDGSLQTSSYNFPTLTQAFGNIFLINKIIPYHWLRQRLGHRLGKVWGQFDLHDQVREVDYVTGACLMVRREVLDQVGLFDPQFFLYFEEKDLCLRMKNAGWKVYFTPQATVLHHIGEGSKLAPRDCLIQRYQSMIYFYQKHYSLCTLIFLRFILAMGCIYRIFLTGLIYILRPGREICLKESFTLWGLIFKIVLGKAENLQKVL